MSYLFWQAAPACRPLLRAFDGKDGILALRASAGLRASNVGFIAFALCFCPRHNTLSIRQCAASLHLIEDNFICIFSFWGFDRTGRCMLKVFDHLLSGIV